MKLPLVSFRLKNFKAVRDSKVIKFTPLTAFIGNNGSGKSSVIEGLQTYQRILTEGLDEAMDPWRGFEHIRNAAIPHNKARNVIEGKDYQTNPILFQFRCNIKADSLRGRYDSIAFDLAVTTSPNEDQLFIYEESFGVGGKISLRRDKDGIVFAPQNNNKRYTVVPGGESIIGALRSNFSAYRDVYDFVSNWQFVSLHAASMGNPRPQKRSDRSIRLESDGSNIAEYLLDIRRKSPVAFEGIIEALQYVLPYAKDIQPTITSELERAVYLQMTEEDYKIPGWLLSSGTLRVLALLALLRHPNPPPLIVIEEIENGLDPRTIHLIVEELRNVVESGTTQIIITTHSPYLLDLLALSHIVLVERIDNQPIFSRPSDQPTLEKWTKDFGPGQLYTMNRLSRRGHS